MSNRSNNNVANVTTERMNLSDSSGDDDCNWQYIPMKRKSAGSPISHKGKRIHQDEVPSCSNRFDVLANNEDGDKDDTIQTTPKPPPIYIPNVGDIAKMVNQICKVIPSSEFNFKSLRDGQVRLMIKSVESYRKIVKYLDSAKLNYHTFQLKQERAFRVVLKGLHHTTSISDIKALLLSLGHQVRSVRNISSKTSKQPLPMFYIDLDPNDNNKDIYKITRFDNAIVQFEPPKKFEEIVQCFRCQDYGHTKSYCKKDFRCVKCAQDHPTSECKKTPDTPAKCVLCSESHTANYKGCTKYQQILRTKFARSSTNYIGQVTQTPTHVLPPSYNNNFDKSQFGTYSQAVRGEQPAMNNVLEKIEAMLAKQIELTNTLMNMMSMLMSKICR